MPNLPIKLERPTVSFYGISLADSRFRTWENNGDESDLIVNWQNIDAYQDEKLDDITITVAQRFPGDSRESVKSLAHDIYGSGKIKVNDSVFGIDDNNLEKIGYVFAKDSTEEKQVVLSVKWVTELQIGTLPEPIISEDAQFQFIKAAKLKKIERKFPALIEKAYNAMPESDKDYKGFESINTAEPIPRMIDENFNEFSNTPKEDKGGLITLFYGTDRNVVGEKDGMCQYGKEKGSDIQYGTCDVQLPEGHRQGELERPRKFLGIINGLENQHTHIVLKGVQQMAFVDFQTNFSETLRNKPKKHALLFVHGYRTTFNEAAYRTAQLAWDLPFNGYAGFFSWPSAGETMPYLADEASARSSVPALKTFISNLLEHTELDQLHIIAHSMGSLVLTLSLKELSNDYGMAGQLDKINQLILGAPDIDQTDFRENILPGFKKIGKQRTVYVSDHDFALEWSSTMRVFRDRLGGIGEDIFVAEGLDTIEVSNLETDSSHSYLFESSLLLSDLYYMLTQGLGPGARRLREIEKDPVNYWLFPK